MIKTLRITSVFIALAAITFVIFIAVTGLSADEKIEELLKTPGRAKQLQAGSETPKEQQEQESALVRQAKAFALRINPPAPVRPAETSTGNTPIRPKVAVSATFELIGTSYYPLNSANSWALINEVGKGWHWVRQGEKVGHLIIKEVADGYVVIDDGGKTYELTPKRVEGISMPGNTPANIGGKMPLQSFVEVVETPQQVEAPKQSKEDIEKNLEWLKSIQKESMELGDEEVNGLGSLGDMLGSLENELKSLESNSIDDTNGLDDTNSVTDANNAQDSKKTEEKPQE